MTLNYYENEIKMNEQRFDELWSRAEAEGYATRLATEYPEWRMKRRRTMGMVAGLALAIAVAIPTLMPYGESNNSTYSKVYCNRSSAGDQYWVDLADELLLS